MPESCEKCRYYDSHGDMGECRRYPPQPLAVVVLENRTQVKDLDPEDLPSEILFEPGCYGGPIVLCEHWCGEFERAKD